MNNSQLQPFDDMTLIRQATRADLPDLVRIHKLAYSSKHFTTLLPDNVLALYYSHFLADGSEIIIAADRTPGAQKSEIEIIQGFAVFGENIPRLISLFKRQHCRQIINASMRHPLVATQKIFTKLVASIGSRCDKPLADFLLLSIAVRVPRKGVGQKLLAELKLRAKQRGQNVIGLFVNTDNLHAINSYFRAGFILRSLVSNQYYMENIVDDR